MKLLDKLLRRSKSREAVKDTELEMRTAFLKKKEEDGKLIRNIKKVKHHHV